MIDKHKRNQDELLKAALVGGATTGGLAANMGIMTHRKDLAENSRVPSSRSYDDFLNKLRKGDAMFHRSPNQMGLLVAAKGDPYYHSSIYAGRNRVIEAAPDTGVHKGILEGPVYQTKGETQYHPEELRVYRPKKNAEELTKKAYEHAKKSIGREYKSELGTIGHGLGHLAGMSGGPSCKGKKGKVVCSELIAEAYPKIFKEKFMSPADMRHHPEMDLVARYGKNVPVTMRERLLSRALYPVVKNLKWGLGAGALAYAGMKARDLIKGDEHARSA